eukprot:2060763-Prymnesium_polylepis.1
MVDNTRRAGAGDRHVAEHALRRELLPSNLLVGHLLHKLQRVLRLRDALVAEEREDLPGLIMALLDPSQCGIGVAERRLLAG